MSQESKKKSSTEKKKTNVVRISEENYHKFTKLKAALALKLGKEKVTYDEFFEETLKVAEALLKGTEYYACENVLYDNPADAWGKAIVNSRVLKKPIERPLVLIKLGKDNSFEVE